MYAFRLYVLGKKKSAVSAIESATLLLHQKLGSKHELQVVDVLETPELAINDSVFVTPTLIKLNPKPERRVIGNFSDVSKVLAFFELSDVETTGGQV